MYLSSTHAKLPAEILTKQLSNLFMQSPVGLCLAKGNDHVIELANKEFLISNAIKYSPGAKAILVTSPPEKNKMKFGVQYFGIGIPAEKQPNVFYRFFSVSGDKQDTFPGLGLGLLISSEIIKRHNGNLTVKSIVGEGSTFCITLPLTADQ